MAGKDKLPPPMAEEEPKDGFEMRACTYIQVEATVERNEKGIVTLAVPCRRLEEDEVEMLSRLFPHTQNQVERFLAMEALFARIK